MNHTNSELAEKLKQAAQKYLDDGLMNGFKDSAKIYRKDHKDLIRIAKMIENNKDGKVIAKAMYGLDTAVRDVIPDSVYYKFSE